MVNQPIFILAIILKKTRSDTKSKGSKKNENFRKPEKLP